MVIRDESPPLNKQQVLYVDSKETLQINFTGNLDQDRYITIAFVSQEANETIFRFFRFYSCE